jgi:ATP-dependent exoDNAse (exonuclease V) beta subunit
MEYISIDQKKIVMNRAKIKKICGCAGSRKTDTMIKCGIYYLSTKKKKHNCIFLTLVGSVTDEITERISNMLQINIEKCGMSNHFMGQWNQHVIEIANYDAFIHKQLELQHVECNHDDYEKKSIMLLEYLKSTESPQFYLKDNQIVDMILIDEFQDVSTSRAEIMIEFFKKNKSTRLVIMGDVLQTIFPQAIKEMKHPLMMIDELKPTSFRLNVCYRCPKSHLDVVNCMTRPFRSRYMIPEIEHRFTLHDNKPLFFTH